MVVRLNSADIRKAFVAYAKEHKGLDTEYVTMKITDYQGYTIDVGRVYLEVRPPLDFEEYVA